MKQSVVAFLLILFSTTPSGADIPLVFPDPGTEQRYMDLLEELRCLVCQNQSLADSHADLAQDLRQEVYDKIISGNSDEEIIEYLVARYGDFVLYRPPLKSETFLLWTGPVIFLLIGILFACSYIKKQKSRTLNSKEQVYAEQLLNENDSSDIT